MCKSREAAIAMEVTPAHVRVPTQRPLVLSFMLVVGKAENFSLYPYASANAHGVMGCDQKSFIVLIVWQRHQLLSKGLNENVL
jgi:hypothetical protein